MPSKPAAQKKGGKRAFPKKTTSACSDSMFENAYSKTIITTSYAAPKHGQTKTTTTRKKAAPKKETRIPVSKKREEAGPARSSGAKKLPRNLNAIKEAVNDKIVCNNVLIDTADCFPSKVALEREGDYLFKGNIADHIVECIETHGKGNTVLGCMAWFTNKKILAALIKHAKRVLFVINDENVSDWNVVLKMYDALPRFQEPLHSAFRGSKTVLRALDRDARGNRFDACTYEPVRCFGNPAFTGGGGRKALMHDKVMIFFEQVTLPGGIKTEVPVSYINGSFNYTDGASNNIENAVFLQSPLGAERFFQEFSIVFAHSRPIRRSR
jgi:hypothetical protein